MADQIPDYSPLQPPLPAGGIPDSSLNLASRSGGINIPEVGDITKQPLPAVLQAALDSQPPRAAPQKVAATVDDLGYGPDEKGLEKSPFSGPSIGYDEKEKGLAAVQNPFGRGEPSLANEMWKGVKHAPIAMEKGLGGALAYASHAFPEGGFAALGKWLMDDATSRETIDNTPHPDAGLIRGAAGGMSEGLTQMAGTTLAGAAAGSFFGPGGTVVGGVVGTLIALPSFFGGVANEGYEGAHAASLKRGETEEQANSAGLAAGGIDGTIMTGAQLILGRLGLNGMAGTLLKSAAGKTEGRLVESLLEGGWQKSAGEVAKHTAELGATMGIQDAAIQGVDMHYGGRDQFDPMQTAQSALAGAGMGLVTGSMSAARSSAKANATKNLLLDPSADKDARGYAALGLAAVLKSKDPVLAGDFGRYAGLQIEHGKPVEILPDAEYRKAADEAAKTSAPNFADFKDILDPNTPLDVALDAAEANVNRSIEGTNEQVKAMNDTLDNARAFYANEAQQAQAAMDAMREQAQPGQPSDVPQAPQHPALLGEPPAAQGEVAPAPDAALLSPGYAADPNRAPTPVADQNAVKAAVEPFAARPETGDEHFTSPAPVAPENAPAAPAEQAQGAPVQRAALLGPAKDAAGVPQKAGSALLSPGHAADLQRVGARMEANPTSVRTSQLAMLAESHPVAAIRAKAAELLGLRKNGAAFADPGVDFSKNRGQQAEAAPRDEAREVAGQQLLTPEAAPPVAKPQSDAHLSDLDLASNAVGRKLTEVHPESLPDKPVDTPNGGKTLTKAGYNEISKLADVYHQRVVLVRGHPDDGFVLHRSDSAIYLNADAASASHQVVFGHELSHRMEAEAPHIFKPMRDVLDKQFTPEAAREFYRHYHGDDVTETHPETHEQTARKLTDAEIDAKLKEPGAREKLLREYVADVVGNRSGEVSTWTRVFKSLGGQNHENKKLVYKLADYIVSFIDRIISRIKLKKFDKADSLLSDMKSAKDAVVLGLRDYAEHAQSNTVSHQGEMLNARAERLAEAKRVAQEQAAQRQGKADDAFDAAKQASADKAAAAEAKAAKDKAEAEARDAAAKKRAEDKAAREAKDKADKLAAKQAREDKAPRAAGIAGTSEPVKRTLTTDKGITFEMRRNRAGDYGMYYDDKKVGHIRYDKEVDGWRVKDVQVDPSMQKQGIATAAHDWLESSVINDKFQPGEKGSAYADFRETRDAKKEAAASANRSAGQSERFDREAGLKSSDTFAGALAKLGGVNRKDAENLLGLDPKTPAEKLQYGFGRRVVSDNGRSLGDLAAQLHADGWLHGSEAESHAEFRQKLHDWINDRREHAAREALDSSTEAELARRRTQQEEDTPREGGLTPDEMAKLEAELRDKAEAEKERKAIQNEKWDRSAPVDDSDIPFSKRRASADPEASARVRADERDGEREKPRMYTGQQSATADHGELHDAMMRTLKGDDRETVRKETGWFRGVDGEWRHEIDDSGAKLKRDWKEVEPHKPLHGEPNIHKLGDVLDHPKLYDAYPDARDIPLTKQGAMFDLFGATQGWFNHESGELNVTPYAHDPLSTMLHEIQHWVQGKEGFAAGGNPEMVRLDAKRNLDKLDARLADRLETLKEEQQTITHNDHQWQAENETKQENVEKLQRIVENIRSPEVQNALTDVRSAAMIHDELNQRLADLMPKWQQKHADEVAKFAPIEKAWEEGKAAREKEFDEAHKAFYSSPTEEGRARLDAARAARWDSPKRPSFDWEGYNKEYAELSDNLKEVRELAKEAKETLKTVLPKPHEDSARHALYELIAGEREARDVQRRQPLTDDLRREVPPYALEGIKDEHTIGGIRPVNDVSDLSHNIDHLVGDDPAEALGISASRKRASYMGKLTPGQEQTLKDVGGIVEGRTVKQAFKGYFDGLGERLEQAIAHRYAPIKRFSLDGFMQARMARGSDGALEALLLFGLPEVDANGAYNVIKAANPNGGFVKVLQNLKGEHQRFFWWVAAHRAGDLLALGKERNFDATKVAELKLLDENTPDNMQRKQLFKDALDEYTKYNTRILEIAHKAGLIDKQGLADWSKRIYVPFYRVMEDSGDVLGPRNTSGLVNQKISKKLTGGSEKLNADLLANVMQNWSHILGAAARNRAARTTLEAAESLGAAVQVPQALKDKNTVHVMVDGQKVFYRVDDKPLLGAVSAMYAQIPSWMKPLGTFKHMLTFGVTVMPGFKIRNLVRDTITTAAISDAKNPLDNLIKGFKEGQHSQDYISMLASGGVIRFGNLSENGEASSVHRLVRMGIPRGQILDSPGRARAFMDAAYKGWKVYAEAGDMSENVNRVALYKKLRAEGKSHMEASFAARDLLDFSDGGTHWAVQFLTQSVPFMNARIQGLFKIGSAAMERPKQVAAFTGAIIMASVGLYLAHKDDPEYKELEQWQRDNYWWAKIGGKFVAIPKPFELGSIGTMAERFTELHADPRMTMGQVGNSLKEILLNQFALNPMPQLIKPFIDVGRNKDGFTQRPIETMAMQKMRPQDRYTQDTSMLARGLGQLYMPDMWQLLNGNLTRLSPVQYDALLKSYFGGLGKIALQGMDAILRPATGQPSNTKALRLSDYTAGFVQDPTEMGSTKYVTQMYDHMRDVEEAYNSWHTALRTGRQAEAKEIYADNKALILQYHAVEAAKRAESTLNLQVRRIQNSTMLSDDSKREQLQRLQKQRNAIAERLMTQQRVVDTL